MRQDLSRQLFWNLGASHRPQPTQGSCKSKYIRSQPRISSLIPCAHSLPQRQYPSTQPQAHWHPGDDSALPRLREQYQRCASFTRLRISIPKKTHPTGGSDGHTELLHSRSTLLRPLRVYPRYSSWVTCMFYSNKGLFSGYGRYYVYRALGLATRTLGVRISLCF